MSEAERAAARFLGYFEQAKLLHESQHGEPLRFYKDTEPECLVSVFERLLYSDSRETAFVGEILHSLVWAQCLGNANHRTTMLFLQAFLARFGIALPSYAQEPDAAHRFQKDLDDWMTRSHAILDQRGKHAAGQARLAPAHQETASAWLQKMLGTQSIALMTMGPQRLMTFISS
ncbi:MAG: hypothetical protein LC620_05780 [Halobacteriales archaeon]|nr:hypothetical protein [Halobacteriales archaeon]